MFRSIVAMAFVAVLGVSPAVAGHERVAVRDMAEEIGQAQTRGLFS